MDDPRNEPDLVPAVSVALVRGDRVLLVRRGREPSRGLYAFPGGRVEDGETVEAAARRELEEETSLQAGPLSLYREYRIGREAPAASGFRLLVFSGCFAGGRAVAGDDADEAGWFSLAEMERLPVVPSVREVAQELLGSK